MKDYFDLWALSQMYDFEGATLVRALKSTFARRGIALEAHPSGLQKAFAEEKSKQWAAFVRRSRITKAPQDFVEIVQAVNDFASPVLSAAMTGDSFDRTWRAGGPWST